MGLKSQDKWFQKISLRQQHVTGDLNDKPVQLMVEGAQCRSLKEEVFVPGTRKGYAANPEGVQEGGRKWMAEEKTLLLQGTFH